MSTQFKSFFPFVRQIFATTITLATTVFFTTGDAVAISISSTVNYDPNTETIIAETLQDGDFLITSNGPDGEERLLGDGADERVIWDFDFNQDPNLDVFKNLIESGSPLLSATVSLTITPTGSLSTDTTGIINTDNMGEIWPTFFITNLPDTDIPAVGETGVIELDLFAPRPYSPAYLFTPEKILSVFNSDTPNSIPSNAPNSIPWNWQDDARISSATLELVVDSLSLDIPEPSSLFGLGVLGVGLLLKRKQNI
ncbi:MAG: PEP-CTERM sorting domain-containing protein [Okeania sp. SIO2D1]|nr:PEP-CTERM sorting domain-containing protein [Okeania sp. SIO2D1]